LSDKKNDEIKKLIDRLQSGLVELFDQLRELRRLLDMSDVHDTALAKEGQPSKLLFSELEGSAGTSSSVAGILSGGTAVDTKTESGPALGEMEDRGMPRTTPSGQLVSSEDTMDVNATVSRLLDPIAHELQVGDLSAEVIGEYIQNARNYLIPKERPNEKVSRDMDIVLKFLRARGKKGIRPDERDNMLKRIARWKAHLSV
jgi:hypothetical protein